MKRLSITAVKPLRQRRAVAVRLTRRFPYAVIYSVASDQIRILAIAHLKRRPLYWAGRQ